MRRFQWGVPLLVVVAAAVAPAAARANAANPDPTTTGSETFNAYGSVTITLNGTWSWPGQSCDGRYGIGWAVDWWGISTSRTPTPTFSLMDATEVLPAGSSKSPWSATVLGSGTESPVGAIGLPRTPGQPQSFFHVGTYYGGEDTNLCAQTMSDGTPYGPWSASATYPTPSEVPTQLCVNLYDEHGTGGRSSGSPNDFSPAKDGDNSIQTNAFDPTNGGGNCVASSSLAQLGGFT